MSSLLSNPQTNERNIHNYHSHGEQKTWNFNLFFILVTILLFIDGDGFGAVSQSVTVKAAKPKDLPPNIIVVLTDDQDDFNLSVDRAMPYTKRLVQEKGVRFTRAFANTPVCCPSRATLFTGKYPHSPGMTKSNRVNCGGAGWREGPELDTISVRMQQRGYRTMFCGKYLNSYGLGDPFPSQVPPGWNEWFALVGNSKYWNYSVSDEGVEVKFGSINGAGDYLTDNLARRAVKFIKTASAKPFFLWISPPAAHTPFAPALRHIGTWGRVPLLHSPAFNASVEGKHDPVGSAKAMTKDQFKEVEEIYRSRGESLQSVDDLMVTLIATIRDRGIENSTFIIFTSDNAFHLGEFRLGFDKRQPYETDIRVPLVISGPGVLQNVHRDEYVSHVDIAPTILDLAGAPIPADWDGKSFKDLLFSSQPFKSDPVLIEYEGEADPITMGNLYCGASKTTFDDLGRARSAGQYKSALCDSWNNTYTCLRGANLGVFMSHEFLFCQFECYAYVIKKDDLRRIKRGAKTRVPCKKNSPNAIGEFYDLERDPHQLENRILHLPRVTKVAITRRLNAMKACRGQISCVAARSGLHFDDDNSIADDILDEDLMLEDMSGEEDVVIESSVMESRINEDDIARTAIA